MDAVGAERSALGLARGLEPALTSQTEVVAVRVFPLSLPFYLHRIVVLSTDTGNEITSNYLVRHLDHWREVPDSPLRTGDWWREAVVQCDRPRVFVIRSSDSEAREFLASRLSLLAETSKYAAYGPCGRTDLADGWMDGWTDRRLGGATNGPFPKPTARPSAHPPIRPPA